MSKSLKAALYSALLFPGSGHFFLGKRVQAALLASISIACVYALLSTVVERAQEISLKIQSGEIPFDIIRITEEVSRQSASDGSQIASIATYVLIICWLVGIVDCYRLGRLQAEGDSSVDKET